MKQIHEPTVAALAEDKIFVDIQPIDDWSQWVYKIYLEDAMAPFFKLCSSDIEKPFTTYRDALKHAISLLESENIITLIELPF